MIGIRADDGVATLNGQLPSLSHKRLAGVLAWWVPGSRDVVNGVAVVPPEEDNNDEVTDAVRLVLEKNPFVNADQIRAYTHDAAVTLEGLVMNETERRIAECDVWHVFGVDKVINLPLLIVLIYKNRLRHFARNKKHIAFLIQFPGSIALPLST